MRGIRLFIYDTRNSEGKGLGGHSSAQGLKLWSAKKQELQKNEAIITCQVNRMAKSRKWQWGFSLVSHITLSLTAKLFWGTILVGDHRVESKYVTLFHLVHR